MIRLKVDGLWLSSIGAYGPVTIETGPHGFEAASWEMSPKLRHPALRGSKRVTVYAGGVAIGDANLQEPGSDGQFSAAGYWHQAESIPAMSSAGAFTTVPNTAFEGAESRAEIDFGKRSSISATAWATTATGDLTLAQLLDGYATGAGLRWRVDSAAEGIKVIADPTTPKWHVPHAIAGRGLTPAEDEFFTHLVGTYITAAGPPEVTAAATVGSSEAATAFRRRTGTVDLTPMGVITLAQAESFLTGMFLLSGARMGWGEGLELAHGDITTPGGTPAPLSQIRSGQMVRLAGTVDTSKANRLPAYTDVVLATTKYTDGDKTISVTPFGYAPRNMGEVLSLAVSE